MSYDMAYLRNVLCYDRSPPSFALSFLCHSRHHTHRYFLTSLRSSCLLLCLPPYPSSCRPPSPSLSLFFAKSTYFLSLCLPRCPSPLPFMLFATSSSSSSSSSVSVRRRSEVGPPAYPHSKGSSPAVAEAKRELPDALLRKGAAGAHERPRSHSRRRGASAGASATRVGRGACSPFPLATAVPAPRLYDLAS